MKQVKSNYSFRKIKAIFIKEIKDVFKNTKIVFLFLLFPVFTYFLAAFMQGNAGTNPLIFLMMHISMVPVMVMASLIAEEKDKNTLKVLILSNVRPMQFLVGIGSFVFIINVITSCLFLPLLHLNPIFIPKFLLVIMIGIFCSTLLGAIVGMVVKGGANIATATLPVSIVFAIVPLMGAAKSGFLSFIATLLYSGQLMNILFDITNNFTMIRIGIMIINALVFLTIFTLVYNNKKLSD